MLLTAWARARFWDKCRKMQTVYAPLVIIPSAWASYSLWWLVLCQLDTVIIIFKEETSSEKMSPPSDLWARLWCIFFMDDYARGPSPLWAVPPLGCCSWLLWGSHESKPASSSPRGHCITPCLYLPALTPLNDGLQSLKDKINSVLLAWFLFTVFYHRNGNPN